MFQPLFDAGVVVENHAVNGRSTRSFRDEGRWDPIYAKLRPGDYVFIEFGHNDQKVNTVRFSTPDDYAENLRRYIRETREKGAVPVLLTPIVRRNFVDGILTDTHGEYLTACAAWRRGEGRFHRCRTAYAEMGVDDGRRGFAGVFHVGEARNMSALSRRTAG